MGFDYEITYKKGSENLVVDTLSCLLEQVELVAISIPTCETLEIIKREWSNDPEIQDIIKRLEEALSSISNYSWDSVDLRYKGRIVVAPHSSYHVIILKKFHSSSIVDHSGYLCTYR